MKRNTGTLAVALAVMIAAGCTALEANQTDQLQWSGAIGEGSLMAAGVYLEAPIPSSKPGEHAIGLAIGGSPNPEGSSGFAENLRISFRKYYCLQGESGPTVTRMYVDCGFGVGQEYESVPSTYYWSDDSYESKPSSHVFFGGGLRFWLPDQSTPGQKLPVFFDVSLGATSALGGSAYAGVSIGTNFSKTRVGTTGGPSYTPDNDEKHAEQIRHEREEREIELAEKKRARELREQRVAERKRVAEERELREQRAAEERELRLRQELQEQKKLAAELRRRMRDEFESRERAARARLEEEDRIRMQKDAEMRQMRIERHKEAKRLAAERRARMRKGAWGVRLGGMTPYVSSVCAEYGAATVGMHYRPAYDPTTRLRTELTVDVSRAEQTDIEPLQTIIAGANLLVSMTGTHGEFDPCVVLGVGATRCVRDWIQGEGATVDEPMVRLGVAFAFNDRKADVRLCQLFNLGEEPGLGRTCAAAVLNF
jgi:hypothetical protein